MATWTMSRPCSAPATIRTTPPRNWRRSATAARPHPLPTSTASASPALAGVLDDLGSKRPTSYADRPRIGRQFPAQVVPGLFQHQPRQQKRQHRLHRRPRLHAFATAAIRRDGVFSMTQQRPGYRFSSGTGSSRSSSTPTTPPRPATTPRTPRACNRASASPPRPTSPLQRAGARPSPAQHSAQHHAPTPRPLKRARRGAPNAAAASY